MPAILDDDGSVSGAPALPFPPVTRQHVLNCSYHSWHPRYRTITPKARLIPLSKPFIDYLRADGIVLPSDEEDRRPTLSDDDSGVFSASDGYDDSDDDEQDVAANWRNIHNAIKTTIADLGGNVMPKLNWSAPKDATWMNANTMMCHAPNDVYLLLKSSDFITHDLEHAFDDTISTSSNDAALSKDSIPYYLVLRKTVPQWNPSVEFRCFVRRRRLLCLCQRDLNHYKFLSEMQSRLQGLIQGFFDLRLRDTFPDENFVFDVYVPPPYDRVWLVDINPWMEKTDSLLFSWREILNMPEPPIEDEPGIADDEDFPEFVRLNLNSTPSSIRPSDGHSEEDSHQADRDEAPNLGEDNEDDTDVDEEIWQPELRLVLKTDPEAFNFNSPQYSAHKLPKDVVEASQNGEGLAEFAREWQNILARRQQEENEAESSEDD